MGALLLWGLLAGLAAGSPRESHRASEVVAAKAGDMRKRLAKRPLAVRGLGASEVAVHDKFEARPLGDAAAVGARVAAAHAPVNLTGFDAAFAGNTAQNTLPRGWRGYRPDDCAPPASSFFCPAAGTRQQRPGGRESCGVASGIRAS